MDRKRICKYFLLKVDTVEIRKDQKSPKLAKNSHKWPYLANLGDF